MRSADGDLPRSPAEALARLGALLEGDLTASGADPLTTVIQHFLDAGHGIDADSLKRQLWLAHVVLTGRMPDLATVDELLLLASTRGIWELVQRLVDMSAPDVPPVDLMGGVLVDVTRTAGSDHQAGIPRVVRELVRHWGEGPDVHYVAWDGTSSFRHLDAAERARLGLPGPGRVGRVAPWNATVVVLEVLRPEALANALEAAAAVGATKMRALVHDLSALVMPTRDATRGPFLYHLSAVAYADRVSCVSASVASDLRDFWGILARSGRTSGEVQAHELPVAPPPSIEAAATERLIARLPRRQQLPVIAAVSTLAPRKNHARLLAAAERAWSQGAEFQLVIVEGAEARPPSLLAAIHRLQVAGRPVALLHQLSDDELWALYGMCVATAYVSLSEGYGLPAVESLAAGTPVIITGYGSMAEIGRGGGVIPVDPRNVSQISDAIRSVVLDGVRLRSLTEAAGGRVTSSWATYAATLASYLGLPAGSTLRAVEGGLLADTQVDAMRELP